MQYTKMNGLKNDFVVLMGPLEIDPDTVARLCDRNNGIGADGLLVITKLDDNQVRMQYWNADGSTAEMCGNGLRCVARYAVMNNLAEAGTFTVQTPVGPLEAVCNGNPDDDVEAQVGKVQCKPEPVKLEGMEFYEANVGNPHAITFVDDTETAPVASTGPAIENNEHFPNKTNVEFVQIISDDHIRLRIWERGVGETPACGTGMVASAVVSAETKGLHLPMTVEVPGGQAKVWLDSDGYARMLGSVEIMATNHVEL